MAGLPSWQAPSSSDSLRLQRQLYYLGLHQDEPELRMLVVYRFPSYPIPKSKIAAVAHMYGLAGRIQRIKRKPDGGACRLRVQGYSSVIDKFVKLIIDKVSRIVTHR